MMISSSKFLLRRNLHQIPNRLRVNNRNKRRTPYFKVIAGLSVSIAGTYDYVVNNFSYTASICRFARSLKVATLISLDYVLLGFKEDNEDYESLLKEVHLRSANKLLNACLANGGLYIKVGQGVAAINHVLPVEYTKTLSKLEDECLPTNVDDIQKVFKQDFAALPEELFKEFNYTPVAAASLAQVFRAKLFSGEDVAVKVQYADLQKRFPSDLGTIMFLQELVAFVFKSYNFGWILRDLRENLIREMDFMQEGKNSEQCANDLHKFKFVHVPTVYWDHTKRRVLTMEWIDGIKINDLHTIKAQNLDLKDIDNKLFTIFAEQIFHTGFVHADPHPGNVFVRKSKNGDSELILLDHGLYQTIPEEVRLPLSQFWEATILKDEAEMERSAAGLNITEYKNFAEVLFQVPYRVSGGRIKSKLTQEDIDYFQEEAKRNFESIMRTLKEMPKNMLFVVRNLNTIRAISQQHGDVVHRPKIMARHAQTCLYRKYNYFGGYIYWLYRRFKFEYCLLKTSLQMTILSLYFNVLYKLGRSPAKLSDIFNAVLSQTDS